ncbi:hypothetical protein DFH08DRAFT_978861 [Mycena albidolilacea]|uniref:Uncharacterized protein n=1 Tax=Mycena albidolilacea TaxID=1033008 RepID=A0AAD6YYA0_9AGAR|nr:hypothetical protein DFH08DRAFT_978861 [Mycena albidolilacea]
MFFSRALLVFASAVLLIPSALGVPASPAANVLDNRATVGANAVITQGKAHPGNPALTTVRKQMNVLFVGTGGILPTNGNILSGGGLLGCLTGDPNTLGGLGPGSLLSGILADPTGLLNGNILDLGGILGGLLGSSSLANLLAALLGSLPGLSNGCTCDADILNVVGCLNNLVHSLNGLLALSGCGCGNGAQVVGTLQPLVNKFLQTLHA